MKKKISPVLGTGLLIFVMYTIIERFIMKIANWITIPLLVVAIVLIIAGGLKTENNKQ